MYNNKYIFRNNPATQASEEYNVSYEKLQRENQSLKARVKLLEEGVTKDLTLLVSAFKIRRLEIDVINSAFLNFSGWWQGQWKWVLQEFRRYFESFQHFIKIESLIEKNIPW